MRQRKFCDHATGAGGNLSSHADDGASSARQESNSPATNDAGADESAKTGFETKVRYRRAITARADHYREARLAAALDRLARAMTPKAPTARPRAVAVLSPFLWLGGRVVLQLSVIVKRQQKKRRTKEKRRRQGGRAYQLRKSETRTAKHDAKAARLTQQRRADRQALGPKRSTPPRSTPSPPPPPSQR